MGNPTDKDEGSPRPVLELLPTGLKPPSAQKRRLLELLCEARTSSGQGVRRSGR